MTYDNNQFNNMRSDAIRRTREMYRNSMVSTSHYSQGDNYKNNNSVSEEPVFIENPEKHINAVNQNHSKSIIPENIGKIFSEGFDSEKLTIIALIIILAKEGADMKLILALGYILI